MSAALTVADDPAQIAVDPDTVAVGSARTITFALPLLLPRQPVASETDVSV